MKHLKYLLLTALLPLAFSCEEEVGTWTGTDKLNFVTRLNYSYQPILADTLQTYTFVFEDEQTQRHTIWLDIQTQGYLSDQPRPILLKQIPAIAIDGEDAVAGVDYVAFDDPEVRDLYVIAAGANTAKIPIILLRNESLKTTKKHLRITFGKNEYFDAGFDGYWTHRTITVSDFFSEPGNWKDISYMFGKYGTVKHQFMSDVTGKAIDDKYIKELVDADDYDYLEYMRAWFGQKLQEENERRANLNPPLGPLEEADGTPVSF